MSNTEQRSTLFKRHELRCLQPLLLITCKLRRRGSFAFQVTEMLREGYPACFIGRAQQVLMADCKGQLHQDTGLIRYSGSTVGTHSLGSLVDDRSRADSASVRAIRLKPRSDELGSMLRTCCSTPICPIAVLSRPNDRYDPW